jgi:hypothetical protein
LLAQRGGVACCDLSHHGPPLAQRGGAREGIALPRHVLPARPRFECGGGIFYFEGKQAAPKRANNSKTEPKINQATKNKDKKERTWSHNEGKQATPKRPTKSNT